MRRLSRHARRWRGVRLWHPAVYKVTTTWCLSTTQRKRATLETIVRP
ncbi:hypothetical protein KIF59_20370 [Enterobacter cloacae subsp. cloacae]|nr:hypothetical protein [Enterobacter cloacae subsp. cloacae]